MTDRQPTYGPVILPLAEVVYRGMNGVYAVFARVGPYSVPLDVGESANVGDRLRYHDRRPEWYSRIVNPLMRGVPVMLEVYATPTPANIRFPQGYRLWVEWFWRTYYKALGYVLCGQRP